MLSSLTPDRISSSNLQRFCGLPVTSAGPLTRLSAAGLQRTLARGGRSNLAVPPPSTLDPTWITQVSSL